MPPTLPAGGANLQDLGQLRIGEHVPECLQCDLELAARTDLQAAIAHCEAVQDCVLRNLLREILDGEEEQIDRIETQIELIAKVGVENDLQSQMGSDD